MISAERLQSRIDALAQIGGFPNGRMCRLCLTPEDRRAGELAREWMHEAGLRTWMDAAGNIFGRREGAAPDLPAVMTGSHLDTQEFGGRYDGIAGVLCAIEAAQHLKDEDFQNRLPLVVVAFMGEENVRFPAAMIGSKAMTGQLTPTMLDQHRCRFTGETLREAMTKFELPVVRIPEAEWKPGSLAAVVELHIEQGPRLEMAQKRIGVVTGVVGFARFTVALKGQQAHSGGMPMALRRDALCAAAEIVLAVERIAKAQQDPPMVGTVGRFWLDQSSMAIVPGQVNLTVDIRCHDLEVVKRAAREAEAEAREICERRGIELTWDQVPGTGNPPAKLSQRVIDILDESARETGAPYVQMPSDGGHDCMNFASRTDVGMLFVPSVGGISHAPEEYTRADDLALGADVLARALQKLAN
ncbi:MAG: M20 family metallo-hydrolase [Chloroflexi bacterium]|nr:M20 family metallo-hydrolase [Chloroflexota bacterium]